MSQQDLQTLAQQLQQQLQTQQIIQQLAQTLVQTQQQTANVQVSVPSTPVLNTAAATAAPQIMLAPFSAQVLTVSCHPCGERSSFSPYHKILYMQYFCCAPISDI